MFGVSIRLGMVAREEVASDLENFEEMLPSFRYELRSMIIDDVVGKTIVPKHSRITIRVVSSLVISLVQGKISTILVYRSTTVKIMLSP